MPYVLANARKIKRTLLLISRMKKYDVFYKKNLNFYCLQNKRQLLILINKQIFIRTCGICNGRNPNFHPPDFKSDSQSLRHPQVMHYVSSEKLETLESSILVSIIKQFQKSLVGSRVFLGICQFCFFSLRFIRSATCRFVQST